MADEEKAQEGPSEAAENKEEEAQEKQESIAVENPSAESAVIDDSKHDVDTEGSDIPPAGQPVDEEGTAADADKEEENDKPKAEEVNGATEEEEAKAPEEEVVKVAETGEETEAETAEKDEDGKEEEANGEPAGEKSESEVEKGEEAEEVAPAEAEEVAPAEGEEGDGEPKEKEDDEEILDQGKDDGTPTEGELQEGGEMVAVEGGEETTEEKGEETEEEMKEEGEGDEKPESPLPQSDTFQDGDRPETPTVQVPEPLSRDGSPKEEPQHLDAGTPEIEESPRPDDIIEEEEEEEEEEEPLYSREELLEAFQAAIAEREQLQNHNTQLQHKLAEYFRKKKSDDQRQEMDKNVTDQEQRYLKYMSNLEELRNQEEDERENFHVHLEELKEKKQEKLELVDKEDKSFTELKRTVASDAISSRSGKPLMPREVEMYIGNELRKEDEVKLVRLENIKLKNRLKKREQQLKAKEELAEGLHLIDFEQLKIENQTYNEKIEERNEELLKLRKKITSTVQVLTHVKEKLQFVQAENQVQKTSLREVEAYVAQKRDLLSRTKRARDSLRIDNQRLRQKCGLLGNTALLRDFEERKDEGGVLRNKLDRLKRQHAELILKSAGVKKKIEETRS